MTPRDLLGDPDGYEPGTGYRGDPGVSLRGFLRGLVIVGCLFALNELAAALFGRTLVHDLGRIATSLYCAWIGARIALHPERYREFETAAERRNARLWGIADFAVSVAIALFTLHHLFVPE